jgi:hypothetical protein
MAKKEKSLSQKLSEKRSQPAAIANSAASAITGDPSFSGREFKYILISIAYVIIMAATILMLTFTASLNLSETLQKKIQFVSVLLFPISIFIIFQGIGNSVRALFSRRFKKLPVFGGCILAGLLPWVRVIFDW